MKKILTILSIVLALGLLGASCKKGGGGKYKDLKLNLTGKVQNGKSGLGITNDDMNWEPMADSVSVKVENGKIIGEYNWGIKVNNRSITGEWWANTYDEKGSFEADLNGNKFEGKFIGARAEVLLDEDNMSETTEVIGKIIGTVTDNMVSGYFTIPVVIHLSSGTDRTTEQMADMIQSNADKTGDPLHNSYLYFELSY